MRLHHLTLRVARRFASTGSHACERIALRGQDWLVDRRALDLIQQAGEMDWFALPKEAGSGTDDAILVKTGRGRGIWRVGVGGQRVFVKVARAIGPRDLIKYLALGGKCEREWKALVIARSRGISCVEPLAVASRSGVSTKSVLVTREFAEAAPLTDWWQKSVVGTFGRERSEVVSGVLVAVADLFARAHERGLIHRDAHAGNIFVRDVAHGSEREVSVALGDLLGARFSSKALPQGLAVESLIHLDQFFQYQASRTERLRFLKLYLAGRQKLCGNHDTTVSRALLSSWIVSIERQRRRHQRLLVRQRDRRIFGSGESFGTFSAGGWLVTAVLKLQRRHVFPDVDVPDRTKGEWLGLLEPLLSDVDRGGLSLASGDQSAVGGAMPHHSIEVHRPSGLLERLLWTLFGSPQRRRFAYSHRMRNRDSCSRLILACAERRRFGLIDRTALVIAPSEEGSPADGKSTL